MKIIILRHVESDHNAKSIVGGWSNSNITKRGMAQAERTGEKLCKLIKGDVSFLSSDLLRAEKTANIIGQKLKQSASYYNEHRELNNGDAANKSKAEAERIKNPVTNSMLDWVPYPNAESWRMMHQRIWDFLSAIIKENHVYLIVSHANAMVEL